MNVKMKLTTAIIKMALFVRMKMVLFTANVLMASQFDKTDLVSISMSVNHIQPVGDMPFVQIPMVIMNVSVSQEKFTAYIM